MIRESLTEIRHTLHQYPDLSGGEQATAERICTWLAPTRPDRLHREIGGHGVLAIYGDESHPLILFRAELDALPIQEASNLSYRSDFAGKAHLCGHDGHMTMLLGLARQWHDHPVAGVRLGLIFQPAEETGQGAAAMLQYPIMKALQPHRIFACHNIPGEPLGRVLLRKGPITAAVHSTVLTLKGQSSHAAEPHLAHSPNRAIAQLLLAAESMTRADRTDPSFTVVTPVHTLIGGQAYGTTPGQGEIHLTLRAADDNRLATLQTLLLAYANKLAVQDQLNLEHTILEAFPASINDPDAINEVILAIRDASLELSHLPAPYAWGEDMGHFLATWPGALIGLGSGVDQSPLHHPAYDFPDDLLDTGIDLFYHLIQRYQKS
ncbi:MAG: amidohydrolase [Saprospiraceae bacterium]